VRCEEAWAAVAVGTAAAQRATSRTVPLSPICVVPNMPATGPMYHFVHDLGLPSVMAGINYVGGRDHAPDEHIRLADFYLGTKHIAALLQRFAEAP